MKKIKWTHGVSGCMTQRLIERSMTHDTSQGEIELAKRSCSQDRIYTHTDDYEYHTCLCNESLSHPCASMLLRIAIAYRDHGTLPCSGGYSEQPAVTMDLIDKVLSLLANIESEDAAKNKSKQKQSLKK